MKIEVDYSMCGGAGECISACESGVWVWEEADLKKLTGTDTKRRMPSPKHPEKCTGCLKCVKICPVKCIKVRK